jgi:thymidylate synthase
MLAQVAGEHAAPVSSNLGVFDRFADAWIECLRMVMRDGRDIHDQDRGLRELLNVSLSAASCAYDNFVLTGADRARIALMVHKYEAQTILPEYRLSYGALFRDHAGVDQVSWLSDRLRSKPEAKSATIGFHVPGSGELSCISLFDCKLREQCLHVNAVFRSQNVLASQPGNVVALASLQRELADSLRVDVGFMTLHVLSAHVYTDDFELAGSVIARADEAGSRRRLPLACGTNRC